MNKDYRRYYILFVTTVLVLTVVSQVIIRTHLKNQENDGNKISLASQQSAVTSNLGKLSYQFLDQKNNGQPTKSTELKIKKDIRKLVDRHNTLLYGNQSYNLDGINSEETTELMTSALTHLNQVEAEIKNLVGKAEFQKDEFFMSSEAYAKLMNEVVFLFEQENTAKINLLKNLELILSAVMVLVLFLEIFLVFRPALNKLSENREKLKRKNEQLEKLDKTKSEFLANMSHEIRTPLNGVIGLSHILTKTKLNTEQHEAAQSIKDSAQNLLDIINEILDFSKLESGKDTVEEVEFNIANLVDDVFKIISPTALSKGLTLSQKINDNVPKTIRTDQLKLRQIITNLMGNAVKFTEQGHINLEISVKSNEGKHVELMFSVEDTGIGIPSDKIDSIFDSFTQADNSTSRKYGGTGLGLSICKKLVGLLNGQIWVKSSLGRGTTFYFTSIAERVIDTRTIDELTYKKEGKPKTTREAYRPKQKLKILVVEDNAINRAVALKSLDLIGLPAATAEDGQEAIDLIKSELFDLVLMDIQMPNVDGYECTDMIRKSLSKNDQPVIIAMTATSVVSKEEQFIDKGMDDFIPKPLDADLLVEKLQYWFE